MWWQRHLSEFVTFLLVVNPFAVLPLFLAVSAGLPEKSRAQARAQFGPDRVRGPRLLHFRRCFLLEQMGVPIRAFQIAGGIVLFLLALDFIRGDTPRVDTHDSGQSLMALAVYPIAIPKIAGPGSMLAAILLTDDDRFNLLGQLATIGVLALVLAITF